MRAAAPQSAGHAGESWEIGGREGSMAEGSAFAARLAGFKAEESPEVVLVVADDHDLIRLCIAWTNTAVRMKGKMAALKDGSSHGTWQWLWDHAEYDRRELIRKSGVGSHGFDGKMGILVGNRILYPDGTINAFVQRYLRDRVLKSFDAKPKRAPKRGK